VAFVATVAIAASSRPQRFATAAFVAFSAFTDEESTCFMRFRALSS